MTCKNCGQPNPENTTFCINCGAKLTPTAAPTQPTAAPEQPTQQPVSQPTPSKPIVPFENRPLSAWAYFGYQILFSIPIVGFIMLIILSTKAARNVNLRNFARSYWCALLIAVILGILFAIISLILSMVFGLSLSAIFASLASGSYY